MGYITQRRKPPTTPHGVTWKNGAGHPTTSNMYAELAGSGVYEQYQETYSWRTGRFEPSSAEDAEENALLSATSSAGVFSALEDEYKNRPQSSYDTGHAFSTLKREVICTPAIDVNFTYSGDAYRYAGNCYTTPTSAIPAGFGTPSSFDSNYYGADAVSKTIPTNPLLDLSVALAELQREGFPKPGSALYQLLGSNSHFLQTGSKFQSAVQWSDTLASENLAVEFGLKPVLSDLFNLRDAITRAQTLWTQHIADSGKLIRRKYSYPITKDSTVQQTGGNTASINLISNGLTTAGMNAAFVGGTRSGKHYLDTVTTRKIDYSGGYTYHLPEGRDFLDTIERIDELSNMLIGHRVNMETLWNLTPWSWLVDWNFNIGTNIHNAESLSQDGLVIAYGYLMCETHIDYHSVVSGPETKSGNRGPFHTIYRVTKKERVKASPFGFGLNPSGFTARQWTILASLGFTKSAGVLRTD